MDTRASRYAMWRLHAPPSREADINPNPKKGGYPAPDRVTFLTGANRDFPNWRRHEIIGHLAPFRQTKPGPSLRKRRFGRPSTVWCRPCNRTGLRAQIKRRFVMQERARKTPEALAIPFDVAKLDRLMEEAGIDILLASSKHNVQYLAGAERAIFFDYMDALGVSRYLPLVVYPTGAPDKAAFIGHWLETHQRAVAPLWIPEVKTTASGSVACIARAIEFIRAAGVARKRNGVELALLPMDAGKALSEALPGSPI